MAQKGDHGRAPRSMTTGSSGARVPGCGAGAVGTVRGGRKVRGSTGRTYHWVAGPRGRSRAVTWHTGRDELGASPSASVSVTVRPVVATQCCSGGNKQLNAPYGAFNHWLIVASTNGIKADDATYKATEMAIQSLAGKRDALVLQIRDVLNGERRGESEWLIRHGVELLYRAARLARSS